MGAVNEVIIGNAEPWSRKLDVGLIGARPLVLSKPPGFFDDCAHALNSRFGNTISAKRIYSVTLPSQYQYKRKKGAVGRLVESPALVITIR